MKYFPCLLLLFYAFTVFLCVQCLFDISNNIIRIFDTYRYERSSPGVHLLPSVAHPSTGGEYGSPDGARNYVHPPRE